MGDIVSFGRKISYEFAPPGTTLNDLVLEYKECVQIEKGELEGHAIVTGDGEILRVFGIPKNVLPMEDHVKTYLEFYGSEDRPARHVAYIALSQVLEHRTDVSMAMEI